MEAQEKEKKAKELLTKIGKRNGTVRDQLARRNKENALRYYFAANSLQDPFIKIQDPNLKVPSRPPVKVPSRPPVVLDDHVSLFSLLYVRAT
jgi:hypothetical protein